MASHAAAQDVSLAFDESWFKARFNMLEDQCAAARGPRYIENAEKTMWSLTKLLIRSRQMLACTDQQGIPCSEELQVATR